MPEIALRIGPSDNGRRMTLDEFDEAEVVEASEKHQCRVLPGFELDPKKVFE